ncbi:hypothetical protein GOODEAATRI_003678 [Goodea atripinnis]|uniref:Recombination activating protein 2 n=1 Tax=Goodea atripinnis TaxID=208336 RepID=A0ABV0N7T0_9TELE
MLILAHEAEHCPQRNNGVSWLRLQGSVFEQERKCSLLVLQCGVNILPHDGSLFFLFYYNMEPLTDATESLNDASSPYSIVKCSEVLHQECIIIVNVLWIKTSPLIEM